MFRTPCVKRPNRREWPAKRWRQLASQVNKTAHDAHAGVGDFATLARLARQAERDVFYCNRSFDSGISYAIPLARKMGNLATWAKRQRADKVYEYATMALGYLPLFVGALEERLKGYNRSKLRRH